MTQTIEDHNGNISPLSSPLPDPWPTKGKNPTNLPFPSPETQRSMRISIDGSPNSEYEPLVRSPILEHEPSVGPSGLDRIRQQPVTRVFTSPSPSTSSITLSLTPSMLSGPSTSACYSSGSSFPTLEDLHRFPSESLHSFSFAQQSEELLHSRQNILKRSIDFMRDRFGWAAGGFGIVNVQARSSGDTELQGMVDLLSRTKILDKDNASRQLLSALEPVTSPVETEDNNIFEKSFSILNSASKKTALGPTSQDQISPDEAVVDDTQSLSPLPEDDLVYRRRDLRSAPASRRVSLKRTYTDFDIPSLQTKLIDVLAHPSGDFLGPSTGVGLGVVGNPLHTHSSKWTPASQAVFRTDAKAPWTILAANDLACLVFGVTQSEVRKLSILEVVQEERRQWLISKLQDPGAESVTNTQGQIKQPTANPASSRFMGMGNGITAHLLSKPPSRQKVTKHAQSDDGCGSGTRIPKKPTHQAKKSRGVLLCGDVVPTQKRNGVKGSASLWVMEKRGGLIWVLEEITENILYASVDQNGNIVDSHGDSARIWGYDHIQQGTMLTSLVPNLPKDCLEDPIEIGLERITETKYFAARTSGGTCVPITVTTAPGSRNLRISSFPHIAGMMVLSSSNLRVISSNSVFSAALFGHEKPEGLNIEELVPDFSNFLSALTEEEEVPLVDGIVISEHSFRRARALWILRDDRANAASIFLQPAGLPAKHRDGSQISVDVQMRVIRSETVFSDNQDPSKSKSSTPTLGDRNEQEDAVPVTEVVYALWISYSRHIHATNDAFEGNPLVCRPVTPLSQVETGQRTPSTPQFQPTHSNTPSLENKTPLALLSQKLNEAASEPLTDRPGTPVPEIKRTATKEPPKKRTISDYVIVEEMGQGAYGQVKLARLKKSPSKKVVLKYVTKKRILVDTWTRDRRLGTVPLEIHVLDYLRRDGFKHPNIVEMEGFFEDDINYYIEMVPHGLPGMDLFDYIELKANMDEGECRNIFQQVVDAIHHLHTKALVVHRDIKDENVVLDGEGRIKLIDFGSAAYIKNGPFDVFVGTIDYAAPEVLQGKSYRGKEQDVWALGILLYTIVYKENPFYNIDEILDHPLRVPFLPFSEDCIDLIRKMLDRDVDNRLTITEVIEHPWMVAT